MSDKIRQNIPDTLHPFFWEYDVETLDIYNDADVIMSRIMERGSWQAMTWLRKAFSNAELKAFLQKKGRKFLPLRELNYWAMICGIPAETRKQWIKVAREKNAIWHRRHAH